jgi:hypothetical protein
MRDPVYAILDDAQVVSSCTSSRQNAESAETWVHNAPAHRLKGLARQVVVAWAIGMRQAGLVPFYSHEVQNQPSAELVRRTGLTPAFEEWVITRAGQAG